MKVRVAIPAANPPDNAIDLTSRRSVARLICGPRKNPMTQRKGLDVPTRNPRQLMRATGFGSSGNNSSYTAAGAAVGAK